MASVAAVTRILMALLAIACGVAGAYALGRWVDDPFAPAEASPAVIAVEGTLRNDGAGWYLVEDRHHHTLNLAVDPGGHSITIRYPQGTSVLSMVATANSQLSRFRIVVTTSAAADHATLRLTKVTHTGVRHLNASGVHHTFGEIRILGYLEPVAAGTNS
jgi:hypothetical protein